MIHGNVEHTWCGRGKEVHVVLLPSFFFFVINTCVHKLRIPMADLVAWLAAHGGSLLDDNLQLGGEPRGVYAR